VRRSPRHMAHVAISRLLYRRGGAGISRSLPYAGMPHMVRTARWRLAPATPNTAWHGDAWRRRHAVLALSDGRRGRAGTNGTRMSDINIALVWRGHASPQHILPRLPHLHTDVYSSAPRCMTLPHLSAGRWRAKAAAPCRAAGGWQVAWGMGGISVGHWRWRRRWCWRETLWTRLPLNPSAWLSGLLRTPRATLVEQATAARSGTLFPHRRHITRRTTYRLTKQAQAVSPVAGVATCLRHQTTRQALSGSTHH